MKGLLGKEVFLPGLTPLVSAENLEEEMSEETTSAEPGRRRRRRRRKRGSGGGSNQNQSNRSNRPSQNQNSRDQRSNQRRSKTPNEKFGGRDPVAQLEVEDNVLPLNAFELFCTYYLGITADNGFRKPNMREVARRFDRSPKEIEDALKECGMSQDILKKISWDMSLAQLDISVAPEGIDKKELAKNLFEEFVAENPHFVDWSEPEMDDQDDDDYDDEEE